MRLLTFMGVLLLSATLMGCGSTGDPVVVKEREVTVLVTPATSAPVLLQKGSYAPFDGFLLGRDATLAVMNGGSTNQYAVVKKDHIVINDSYLFHPDLVREQDGYITYKKD
jgi:hypothetical protein